jgi:CPA2 family monovalent cation:H+ antiporter-2
MHAFSFLADLAWVVGLGALMAALFQRMNQPLVLGYLVAGLLLNSRFPYLPDISRLENIHLLAELGVVFIMFFIGLHFNFRKLRSLGWGVIFAGTFEVALVTWLGYLVARWMGFTPVQSVVFGSLFCTASTTIIAKSLSDEGRMKEDFAGVIVGMTLVEDLAAIGILVFLSGMANQGAADPGQVLAAVGKVLLFTLLTIGIGWVVLPRFLRWVDRVGSSETLSMSAIGVCFGVSAVAAMSGVSTALGAFLAGALIAESGLTVEIEERLSSVRDLFLTVFFVTVGLQLDFATDRETLIVIAVGLGVAFFGRSMAGLFGALFAGYDLKTALHAGLSLTAIGELSFVIAKLGLESGTTPQSFFSMAVVVSTTLTFVTPYFVRRGDHWAERIEAALPSPWLTFLRRYQSWVSALRWPLSRLEIPAALYPLVARGSILLILMGLVVLGNWALGRYLAEQGVSRWVWEGDLTFAREVFFGIVFFLLFLALMSALRQIFRHLLKAGGGKMDSKGQTLLSLVQFLSALIIGSLVLLFATPFVSVWTLLVVVVVVLFAQASGIRTALSRMETRFDGIVDGIVASYGIAESSTGEMKALMQDRYPWKASLTDFMLPPTFCAVNQPLSALKLRKKTGASLIAVYRGEPSVTNPGPEFQPLPSDVLVLLGEREHLEAASNYLTGLCRRPHPQMEGGGEGFHLDTVGIPRGSALAGKTLGELAFRSQTGVSVVGVERGGVRHTSLSSETALREGDSLLLLGKPDDVANAQRLVENGGVGLGSSLKTEENA